MRWIAIFGVAVMVCGLGSVAGAARAKHQDELSKRCTQAMKDIGLD
jgi:hypothetical protein